MHVRTTNVVTDLVIAFAGSQSNGAHLWQLTDVPPTPLGGTYMWTGSSWGAVTGDGAIELCNRLKTSTGRDVRLLPCAVGGVPLSSQSGAAQYWLDISGGQPYADFLAMCSAASVVPNINIMVGMEGDCNGTNYSTGVADLGTFYSRMLSDLGLTAPQMPFVMGVTGLVPGTNPSSIYVKNSQIQFGNTTTGVTLGPAYYDLPTSDGVHFYANKANGLDLKCLARRLAQSAAKALGAAAYSAAGPQMNGARATGNRALVTVQHNGGSVLVPTFNFQTVTGFTAYDPSTGAVLPTHNIYCTGRDEVMLEFSSSLGGVLPMIRYQQLGTSDPTNPVYDDNIPVGDSYGCPLMPGVVQAVAA